MSGQKVAENEELRGQEFVLTFHDEARLPVSSPNACCIEVFRVVKNKTNSYKIQNDFTILTGWSIKLQMKVIINEHKALQRGKVVPALQMIQ